MTTLLWVAYRGCLLSVFLTLFISAGIFLFLDSWEKVKIKPVDTPFKICLYLGILFSITYAGVAFASTIIPPVEISLGGAFQTSLNKLDIITNEYKKQDYVSGRLIYINAKLQKVIQTDTDIKERLKLHKERIKEENVNQAKLIARVNNYNKTTNIILHPDLLPPPNNVIDPPILDANYKAIRVFIEDIQSNMDDLKRVDSNSIGIVKELDEIEIKQLPVNKKLTRKEIAFDEVEDSQRKLETCLIKHNF